MAEVLHDIEEGVKRLSKALAAAGPEGTLVLGGAGLSTESGIPDYRGPTGRARPATPMTYQDFVSSDQARQRYWARSHLGWRMIARASPNAGHQAVAALQRAGLLAGIITQNVDGLHQVAGAEGVIELHGTLNRVVCLNCGNRSSRDELDRRLRVANTEWELRLHEDGQADGDRADRIQPDGDADLAAAHVGSFTVVDCLVCSGLLKPDVIFFGENVPPERVAACYQLVEISRGLLVLGSSLTVASGFRFVKRAASAAIPIDLINQGKTRGDALAGVRVDAPLGQVLTALAQAVV